MDRVKTHRIRLSVVDDHPVVLMGIQLILRKTKNHSIELINKYTSGTEVIEDIRNLETDVILIDLCLPDIKGYELAKMLLEIHPDIKIGIYSSMVERDYILSSFKNGVLGYLPKGANSTEIIDFIQTISRGERYIRGIIADIIFEHESIFEKQKELNITKREIEVLELILKGLKNKEIADKLSIAERTVEFHKQNIYLKFEVTNSVDLYKAAQRLNLSSEKVLN